VVIAGGIVVIGLPQLWSSPAGSWSSACRAGLVG